MWLKRFWISHIYKHKITNPEFRYYLRRLPVKKYIKVLLIKLLAQEHPESLKEGISGEIAIKTSKFITLYRYIEKHSPEGAKELFFSCYTFCKTLDSTIYLLALYRKVIKFDLEELIPIHNFIDLYKRGKNLELFISFAKKFKRYNLEENEQGKLKDIFYYVDIEEEHLNDMVNIMIKSKKEGFPISQKFLIKYYDTNPPHSHNLKELYSAMRIYHKISIFKDKGIEIQPEDFIFLINIGRKPKKFIINLYKILISGIEISYQEFLNLTLDQEQISKLIQFYIVAKKLDTNLEINFKYFIDNLYIGIDSVKVLKIWTNLKRLGISMDLGKIVKYVLANGDDIELIKTYILNKAYGKKGAENLIDHLTILYKILGDKVVPQRFVFAVAAAKDIKEKNPNIFKNGTSIEDRVVEDYIAGYEVFTILNAIKFVINKGGELSYPLAKLLSKEKPGLMRLVHNAFVPQPFECHKPVIATTKDHIEIKAHFHLEVTLNLNNYYTGVKEDMLCEIVSTLFVEEIQHKLHHKEILDNVDEISENIIKKLENYKILVPNSKSTTPQHENSENHHEGKYIKLTEVSKWKVHKIVIPRIDFLRDTFMEIKKIEEEFHHELKLKELEIQKLEAEIDVYKAWAKDNNIKYLILKDEEPSLEHHSNNTHSHQHKENNKTHKHETNQEN